MFVADRAKTTEPTHLLLRRRRWLSWSRVAQHEESQLPVSYENVSARIHQHVFCLVHEFIVRVRTQPLGWLRWNEPADFPRQARILDVIYAQSCVEISEIDQIGLLLDIGRMLQDVGIVRSEAPTLLAKILVRHIGRRHRSREDRCKLRLGRIV